MMSYMMEDNVFFLLMGLDYTSMMFFFGFMGAMLNRKNMMLTLACIELMFLASVLNFFFLGHFTYNFVGICYGVICLLLTMVDTSMGLSLVVVKYSSSKNLTLNSLTMLRG